MSAPALSSFPSFTSHPAISRGTIPAGIAAVDELTGGIPRAAMTEIFGRPSSGRTTLMMSLLSRATQQGESCVVVDVQDTFDPQSAAAFGIQLTHLLWVRCGGNLEHALKATDLLIRAGGFGMVILDLTGAPYASSRRIPLTSWFRLRHGAGQSGAALIVTAQDIHTGSCSQLQIELRQDQAIWSGKLLRGMIALAGLRKRNQMRTASFRIAR